MCERYVITQDVGDLLASLKNINQYVSDIEGIQHARTSTNVAPQTYAPVYRNSKNGERVLEYMRWSLQPSYATEMVAEPTFNCRGESLQLHHPAWVCGQRNRAVVPMNGYYVWGPDARSGAPPFYVYQRYNPLLYAIAIWDQNYKILPNGQELRTYAIVTMDSVEPTMRGLHASMPVFIEPQDIDLWLDGPFLTARRLLNANPKLHFRRVDAAVNDPSNQSKTLLRQAPNFYAPVQKKARTKKAKRRTQPHVDEPMENADSQSDDSSQTDNMPGQAPPKRPRSS